MASTASRRKRSRSLLVQALYQWQLAGASLNRIEAEFHTDNDMSRVDVDFFSELLHGVPGNLDAIDAAFEPFLDRKISELDPVSLAVLRLSTYEFLYRIDVPYKVVINEGVNLTKTFGPTDAHKYVNGVLDKVASKIRVAECRAARGQSGSGHHGPG